MNKHALASGGLRERIRGWAYRHSLLMLLITATSLAVSVAQAFGIIRPSWLEEPEPAPTTRSHYLTLFDANGNLAGGWAIEGTVQGTCEAGESFATSRRDAARCFADDSEIIDPCFIDPNVAAEFVACPSDYEDLIVRAFVYRDLTRLDSLKEPLTPLSEDVLAMRLANGAFCTAYSGGTIIFAGGLSVTHYCWEDALGVAGGVDRSQGLWTVRVFPLEGPLDVETQVVAVLEAWS